MRSINWISFALILLISSCGQKEINSDVYGIWEALNQEITVRTSPEWMKFEFHKGIADVRIEILETNEVKGSIGEAKISEGSIKTNWLMNPETTGVAYTIELKLVGKIHENDPLESKEVELWINPDFRNVDWELRYTEGGAQFPMAGIYFNKKD